MLTTDGNLYGCGKADSYQIQPMDFKSRKSDVNVTDKIIDPAIIFRGGVTKVACGFKHTVFCTD
jgi:alpha-tubulin suppressor-like RCC1 family protein